MVAIYSRVTVKKQAEKQLRTFRVNKSEIRTAGVLDLEGISC
jgi:hypothetical protein